MIPQRMWDLPRSMLLTIAAGTVITTTSCNDTPSQPRTRGTAMASPTAVQFAETDVILGSIEAPVVTISNVGTGNLMINAISIEGMDAAAFSMEGGNPPFSLSPGARRDITISFAPTAVGSFSASLRVETDDPMSSELSVGLSGMVVRFAYEQVDRMGIPALNTVFNHPSGIAGFDKTAYNVASPADDVATYRDQFIVVLDAVGNADSGGTADLLLPDELPVNMGVPTAFAGLTGRAPVDDATDVALTVTVGVPGLQSDNVGANDVPFLNTFPFLAEPH